MAINIRLPKPSGLKSVMTRMTIMTIPENALLDGVVKQLDGRESFKDTDKTLNEKIYQGDVFEAIASELEQNKKFLDACMLYPNEKVINQLEELAKLVDTDYVLITKA
jgi:hypothetical protein